MIGDTLIGKFLLRNVDKLPKVIYDRIKAACNERHPLGLPYVYRYGETVTLRMTCFSKGMQPSVKYSSADG